MIPASPLLGRSMAHTSARNSRRRPRPGAQRTYVAMGLALATGIPAAIAATTTVDSASVGALCGGIAFLTTMPLLASSPQR